MSSPKLLLVDELSLGLAPKVVSQLYEILAGVNRELGTSILLVEQFVHMALSNSSRAYVLAKGSVVMAGDSADLLRDPELVATYLGKAQPRKASDETTTSFPLESSEVGSSRARARRSRARPPGRAGDRGQRGTPG
jgi:ABC-type glutathione transport system ATPase component